MSSGELLIVIRSENGRFEGRLVTGLAEPGTRALIVAEAGGDNTAARALMDTIVEEMRRSEVAPGRSVAIAEATAELRDLHLPRSLLVALSPDGTRWQEQDWQAFWLAEQEGRVLPALPLVLQLQTSTIFAGGLRNINAVFWRRSVAEIVSAVLARLGLIAEIPRIFISYRRTEASGIAMQLFDSLAERNFDVFLDYFRVPPGIDFQRRLKQEIGDKSVVLVLESKGILDSEWTRYEIDTAKSNLLGLIALHLPDGTLVPSIDNSRRHRLEPDDFEGGWSATARLKQDRLASLLTDITAEHDRALRRRYALLRNSVAEALKQGGWTISAESGAFIHAEHGALDRAGRVWVCARPPELTDFHTVGLNDQSRAPECLAVVGLTSLLEPRRGAQLDWLARISKYALYDTGDLVRLANALGVA
jgi:hypothetical protein